MNPEIMVLRLVHVLGGVFWLGSGLFTAFFLMPALATAGPAVRLMWIMSGGFSSVYFGSGAGRSFAVSGALAIIGFLAGAGMAVARYVA